MEKIFVIIYKILKRSFFLLYSVYGKTLTYIKLKGNGVKFSTLYSNGVPIIDIEKSGKMTIGKNFRMNNGKFYNQIGRQQQCMFIVSRNGFLIIGDNVGISSSTFVCTLKIEVGSNVKVGGNCVFYDTDFHSLNYIERRNTELDNRKRKSLPIMISDDVFIGAHCTILKGVSIGARSIIGAGSIVRKSIPADEIWAGNPAVFIKNLQK